jgi:hypothetical protein
VSKKKQQLKSGIEKRTGDADEVMYGGADNLGDGFWDTIDETATDIRRENETLKERIATLEQQVAGEKDKYLVPHQDGNISYKRFTISRVGLEIPEDASGEEMAEIGIILRTIESAVQWCIGDWAKYLSNKFNVSYEELAQQFGYTVETLYSYASVCDAIPILIRNQGVSFSHHRSVTKMKPREQREWLALATKNEWKVAQLRAAIRGTSDDDPPTLSQEIQHFARNLASKREKQIETVQNLWEKLPNGAGGEADAAHLAEVIDEEIAFLQQLKRMIEHE